MRHHPPPAPGGVLDGFRAGDHEAFATVYDEFAPVVYAIARRATGSHHEAEEVLQQTFLAAWRSSTAFDPTRPIGPWLATIARRVVIDRYRARRVRPVEVAADDRATSPDPTDDLALAWDVRRALDRLSGAHRELLQMVHLEELEHAEIARRLGIPLGTVKSRVHRARLALLRQLAQVPTESEEHP